MAINGSSLILPGVQAIPLDDITEQMRQQLSSHLGSTVGMISILFADGRMQLAAAGATKDHAIGILREIVRQYDEKKQVSGLIIPGV